MARKEKREFVLWGIENGCSPTTGPLLSAEVRTKEGSFHRMHIAIVERELFVRTLEKGLKKAKEYRIPIPNW